MQKLKHWWWLYRELKAIDKALFLHTVEAECMTEQRLKDPQFEKLEQMMKGKAALLAMKRDYYQRQLHETSRITWFSNK